MEKKSRLLIVEDEEAIRSGLADVFVYHGYAVETAERANQGKINGRDHNHHGFTAWMAGGGVKGGISHGATDEFGFQAVEDRVSIHDLHATMLNQLGIDHELQTYRFGGRDIRLTDVHGHVVHDILA